MGRLSELLSEDLKDAMRSGDALRRDEIRGLIAVLKAERQNKLTRELDRVGLIVRDESATLTPEQRAGMEQLQATVALSDDEEQRVLLTRMKQHQQSLDSFREGKREDLASKEEAQMAVLQRYLPEAADEGAIESAVVEALQETGAAGPRDQGKVMTLLAQRLRGRADMKQVSALVQARLAARA